MRRTILDALGLLGFGTMTYGLYLRFGSANALIVAGGIMLLAALAAARAQKRAGGRE